MRQLWCGSVKKTKFWSLYERKCYNARQFITQFLNKGLRKNSIHMLLVKFGTVDRRLGCCRRSARTDVNVDTVESLLLSHEDKPQSHRKVREISREAGVLQMPLNPKHPSIHPLIISFTDYSQRSASQVLQDKARSTADWCTQHARVIFGMQFENDNMITSKPAWKLKHANSILESFEYLCQILSKPINTISSYTVSHLGHFSETQYVYIRSKNNSSSRETRDTAVYLVCY